MRRQRGLDVEYTTGENGVASVRIVGLLQENSTGVATVIVGDEVRIESPVNFILVRVWAGVQAAGGESGRRPGTECIVIFTDLDIFLPGRAVAVFCREF